MTIFTDRIINYALVDLVYMCHYVTVDVDYSMDFFLPFRPGENGNHKMLVHVGVGKWGRGDGSYGNVFVSLCIKWGKKGPQVGCLVRLPR